MMKHLNQLLNTDGIKYMQSFEDGSVDCICTDPPYLYLKNQKLDKLFDEEKFFSEAKRVLKNDGFIILFGRGTSFYRWNTKLAELGFLFKEEIIWNKSYNTAPTLPISRVHETISLSSQSGILRKVKVPYLQARKFDEEDLAKVINDVNRIKAVLGNEKSLDDVKFYLENGFRKDFRKNGNATNHRVTYCSEKLGNQTVNPMVAIKEGMKEKSIIKVLRDHYNTIHGAQKPVELIERLLKLTTDKNDLVYDPFAGSCSTGIAALNIGRNFIACEIDKEFYEKAIEKLNNREATLFDNGFAGVAKC